MSCLEFRRAMETAPNEVSPPLRQHARDCATCTAFARRIGRLDHALQAAARVPVPDNLEARILMRQSFGPRRPARRRQRLWPALAAGLLVFMAVSLFAGRTLYRESGLQTELVAVVEAADYALAAPGPVPDGQLGKALRPVGLSLSEPLGRVSFAGRCLVRGNLAGHLVLRERSGPVTVFLMPDERVFRHSRFARAGWNGMLVPAGQGTVGIVVPGDEGPDPDLVQRVLRSIRWQA